MLFMPFSANSRDLVSTPGPPVKCNGMDTLCSRRFDDVSFATTHNAMSNADDGWTAPNQEHNLTRQLLDGIRGFMLDLYYYKDEVYLCHSYCFLGKKRLADALEEFKNFLDANPNEVIAIFFESYVSAQDVGRVFEQAGLIEYLHAQTKGQPWPTLEEMITSGKRMVVFADPGSVEYPWYHKVWDFCWETNWSNRTAGDMTCGLNRGSRENDLFILNHFLTRPIALQRFAQEVNFNPFFLDRALSCRVQSGRLPNFVTVDFYSTGDVFNVVDILNGGLWFGR